MAKDEAAIKPTFSITNEEEVVEATVEDAETQQKEDAVADLKYHLGFQEIQKMIEGRIASYRSGQDINLKGNDDFEDIGRKFMISSLVAVELESVLGAINAAAESKKQRGE